MKITIAPLTLLLLPTTTAFTNPAISSRHITSITCFSSKDASHDKKRRSLLDLVVLNSFIGSRKADAVDDGLVADFPMRRCVCLYVYLFTNGVQIQVSSMRTHDTNSLFSLSYKKQTTTTQRRHGSILHNHSTIHPQRGSI